MSSVTTSTETPKAYFEVTLPRKATMKVWRAEGPESGNEHAKKLQDLFDKNLSKEFDAEKERLEKLGHKFIQPKGKISEVFESGKTAQVPISFQVKGGCMTWYFHHAMDMTTQEERDEIFQSAAVGHLEVADRCESYWRGTNSLHVKKMHTHEDESNLNHNHYRVQHDKDVGPSAVAEHLIGMVAAQQEMGLMVGGKQKYLTLEEAAEISKQFNEFWVVANHDGPAWTYNVNGKTISLPTQEESLISAYKKSYTQKFTKEDEEEWAEHRHEEEPCTTISKSDPISVKLPKIKEGMRGKGSDIANTRQVEWSKYKAIATVVKREDTVK